MTAEEFESTDNKYLFMEKKKFAEAYHQSIINCKHEEVIGVRWGYKCKECNQLIEEQ